MSRPGNPYDNAKAESFMKTLKTEEVDGRRFKDIEAAKRSVAVFIDTNLQYRAPPLPHRLLPTT